MSADILLFVYVTVCVYTDLRYRRIYNAFSAAAIILGLGFSWFSDGNYGALASLEGLLAGFFLFFFFYLLGGLGAGDVKFMAAVGTIKGPVFVLMGGLYGAIIGGIAAFAVLCAQKRSMASIKEILNALLLFLTLRSPKALRLRPKKVTYLPYSVFLSLGLLLYRFIQGR